MSLTKIFQKTEPITIIIPSAGLNRRMKKGPKALLDIEGEKLIIRQLKTLKKVFPYGDFIVVLGYGADLIYPILPPWVRVVENEFFETTNVVRSISLALRASIAEQVLIVYGDLIFSRTSLLMPSSSSLFLLKGNPKSDIGANIEDNKVVHMSYISELKWSQIVFLKDKELQLFKKYCYHRDNRMLFGHEILNMVMTSGGSFNPIYSQNIWELDTISDLTRLRLSEERI